jgi:single-strand DNA-binding protein
MYFFSLEKPIFANICPFMMAVSIIRCIFAEQYPVYIMASVNKVILLGHVGKEPDVRYVDQGVCVAQVRLATSERAYRLQDGTEVPERTEWHNIIFWRRTAEIVEKYVHTGDLIYVEGKIQTRSYDDKKGITRYITEIWVDSLKLFNSKMEADATDKSGEK